MSSSLSISYFRAIGHRRGAWTTGVTSGSVVIWKCPSKFPIPWNRSGYARVKSSVELIVKPLVTAQFNVTRFKSRDVGRPRITGPGVSTTYNSVSHCRLPYEHGITIVVCHGRTIVGHQYVCRWRKCCFDGAPLSSNSSGYMRLKVRAGRIFP